jgi:predicted nuclease of predicted toxin-antitoxin system
MKILVDQNISFRLIARIAAHFPEAAHVKSLDLMDADDFEIFQFARQQGFDVVLTQDDDFMKILLQQGPPPRIIWLRTGNCSTEHLATVLIANLAVIQNFFTQPALDCLEIFR